MSPEYEARWIDLTIRSFGMIIQWGALIIVLWFARLEQRREQDRRNLPRNPHHREAGSKVWLCLPSGLPPADREAVINRVERLCEVKKWKLDKKLRVVGPNLKKMLIRRTWWATPGILAIPSYTALLNSGVSREDLIKIRQYGWAALSLNNDLPIPPPPLESRFYLMDFIAPISLSSFFLLGIPFLMISARHADPVFIFVAQFLWWAIIGFFAFWTGRALWEKLHHPIGSNTPRHKP